MTFSAIVDNPDSEAHANGVYLYVTLQYYNGRPSPLARTVNLTFLPGMEQLKFYLPRLFDPGQTRVYVCMCRCVCV